MVLPRVRFYACWGYLADLGERDEVSSSANPGALDGQLWQLSGQRAGPAAHAWRRVEQIVVLRPVVTQPLGHEARGH